MKTFTIDADNNITVHPSRQVALATGSSVFSNPKQFASLIGPDPKRLVEIWNSLTGATPVRKFKDSKTAAERIWKAIQNLGDAPRTHATQQPATSPAIETPEVVDNTPAAAVTGGEKPAAALKPNEPTTDPEAAIPALVAPDVALPKAHSKRRATRATKAPTPPTNPEASRPSSKTATILQLMQQPGGATLHAIMEATEWQAHSVRGFISGTLGKKMGLAVLSVKSASGERTYSLRP